MIFMADNIRRMKEKEAFKAHLLGVVGDIEYICGIYRGVVPLPRDSLLAEMLVRYYGRELREDKFKHISNYGFVLESMVRTGELPDVDVNDLKSARGELLRYYNHV